MAPRCIVSRDTKNMNAMHLAFYGSTFVAAFGLVGLLFFHSGITSNISLFTWLLVIYLGVFIGAACRFLQFFGQERTNDTVSSIIYSLTPISALLAGVFIGEFLNLPQYIGSFLILAAIFIIIREKHKKTQKK